MPADLPIRLRRLRRTSALRDLVRETQLSKNDLVFPIFVNDGITERMPVPSMPGVDNLPESALAAEVQRAWDAGIKAVILFGVTDQKDAIGEDSLRDDGLMARMIRIAKSAVPEIAVISDNCFCEYTDHGHCGVLCDGAVDNDATLANLAQQAVVAARAGADLVAPSGMMDGMVGAMRARLDAAGFSHVGIMAYSSKFASAFYGPFRDAVDSTFKGNRHGYQLDAGNAREAIAESLLDEQEGADILMVKPGIAYLDILARLKQEVSRPLAVYQVSGEYAMIKHAAAAGALDEKAIVLETLTSFKRAGADLILTYFAVEVAGWLEG
ncbi:MAG: porphobilinogen synthase [Rhodothermales bacterium]|jgi:porphobilinogen synthase